MRLCVENTTPASAALESGRRRRSRAIRYVYLPSFASSFGGLGGGSPPEQLLHPRDRLCPLTPLLVLVGAVAAVGAGRHGVTDRQDFTADVNRLRLVSHSRLAALLLALEQASEMLQPQRTVEARPAVLSPQYERERRVIFRSTLVVLTGYRSVVD